MEAKKTLYNNTFFRSKLEAKWAVFFDLAGIKYQYEPEAFLCEDKSQYTPDFFLPDAILRSGGHLQVDETVDVWDYAIFIPDKPGVYLEIKPINYISDALYEKRITSAINPYSLVLMTGDPVESITNNQNVEIYQPNQNVQLSPYWDNCMVLMYCKLCGMVKFDFDEGNYYNCPNCHESISGNELDEQAVKARNFKFQFYDAINA